MTAWAAAILLCASATGQELDASGLQEAPETHDPRDPAWGWSPADQRQGEGSFSVVGEYVRSSAVRIDTDGNQERTVVLLDQLAGTRVGGTYDFGPVALGATVPLWLSASGLRGEGSFTMGDAHLWAPVSLAAPAKGRPGWGLAMIPYAGLPTGDGTRLLGDGFSPGLLATGERRWQKVGGYGTLGVEVDGAQEAPVPGGPKLRLGVGGSISVTHWAAAHVEARAASALSGPGNTPGEVQASFKARHAETGLWFTTGVGRAVLDGLGASPFRGWLGIGYGPRDRTAELQNVPVMLTARTAEGAPLRGAEVRQDGVALGTTDANGELALPRDLDWQVPVEVMAQGVQNSTVAVPAIDAVTVDHTVQWAAVPLLVRVGDAEGQPVDTAEIRLDGPTNALQHNPDEPVYGLVPGSWTLTVGAGGFGTQTRAITVEPGRLRPMTVEVRLQPAVAKGTLALAVQDQTATPVEGARVTLDGVDLGTTGTGGALTIEGLAAGSKTASVLARGFRGAELPVDVGQSEAITLAPEGGALTVQVSDAQGLPANATVAVRGPERVATQNVGADGTTTLPLALGVWQVEVSAPTLGTQERTIEVKGGTEKTEVVLLPDEGGRGELVVNVIDDDGAAIPGAVVTLDGQSLGTSGSGGELRVYGVASGERTVEVAGEGLQGAALTVAAPDDGIAELDAFVAYEPGSVEVVAHTIEGMPIDAILTLKGPDTVAPIHLGADGRALVQVKEGTWQVEIAGEGVGTQTREIVVGPDGVARVSVGLTAAAGTADLAVTVTDADQAPLAGAHLLLDGTSYGYTTGGPAVLGGLKTGEHTLEVVKAGHAPVTRTVKVGEEAEVAVNLAWAGSLRVSARAGDADIDDAVVRIAGPRLLPPARLIGAKLFPLGVGAWDVLVSSVKHGMQQQHVDIQPTDTVRELRFDMQAPPSHDAVLLVRVQDDLRLPVAGAQVRLDGELVGTTSAGGAVLLSEQKTGTRVLEVLAPDLHVHTTEIELAPGSQQRHVRLVPPRTPVQVTLHDAPLDTEIWVEGPHPAEPEPGTTTWQLGPGRWQILARGGGTALHRRVIDVPHGWWKPLQVDLALGRANLGRTLTFDVRDQDGLPVGGAEITLDGVLAGSTDRAGRLEVPEVPSKSVVASASSQARASLEVGALPAEPGAHVVHLQLGWLPGSVKVVARTADGKPANASAGFRGPRRVRPIPLGDRGQRVFVLPEGDWVLEVASEGMGAQERGFTVDPDQLVTLHTVLQPAEQGPGELAIRVLDPEGAPIEGASVALDGAPLGASGNRGEVRLLGVKQGVRTVTVDHPNLRKTDYGVVTVAGLAELDALLRWSPGSVKVLARGPDRAPVDAMVRLRGPSSVDPVRLGSDGTHLFELDPGEWDLLVSSGHYGLQSRELVVTPNATEALSVEVDLIPPELGFATLRLAVVSPDGEPVVGARAALDGVSIGTTGSKGTLEIRELQPGKRKVAVTARALKPLSLPVTLKAGAPTELPFTLGWGAGAVRVRATAKGTAIDDAVVRVAGPEVLPPMALGADGERVMALAPGDWSVLVSSPTWGMQQREVQVSRREQVSDLVFEMVQPTEAQAVLLLRVQDENRQPVAGATVSIGGKPIGTTSSGGAVLAPGLKPGDVAIAVTTKDALDDHASTIKLEPGSQERSIVLRYPETPVELAVSDRAGRPLAAGEVIFSGAVDVPVIDVKDGKATVKLRPGEWSALAKAPDFAPLQKTLKIKPGDKAAKLVFKLSSAKASVAREEIRIQERVHFEVNKAEIKKESQGLLDEVAGLILSNPGIVQVEIQGHTDNSGGRQYNLELSQRRAQAVRAALIDKGVFPGLLISKGYGQSTPVDTNDTPEGRAANRRVQFEILEWVGAEN